MSDLLNKSDINIEASKLLDEKNLYSSVAHCAYYACYQRLKHIWLYKFHKSEDELDALGRTKPHSGSHEILINQIVLWIQESSKVNKSDDYRVLNSTILQLKRLRIKADYEDSIFDSSKSRKAIELSNDIIPILKKYQ